MSVSVVYLPSAKTSPWRCGDRRLIGTPASMSESEDPQTDAIELDPFDESTSETRRST